MLRDNYFEVLISIASKSHENFTFQQNFTSNYFPAIPASSASALQKSIFLAIPSSNLFHELHTST